MKSAEKSTWRLLLITTICQHINVCQDRCVNPDFGVHGQIILVPEAHPSALDLILDQDRKTTGAVP